MDDDVAGHNREGEINLEGEGQGEEGGGEIGGWGKEEGRKGNRRGREYRVHVHEISHREVLMALP